MVRSLGNQIRTGNSARHLKRIDLGVESASQPDLDYVAAARHRAVLSCCACKGTDVEPLLDFGETPIADRLMPMESDPAEDPRCALKLMSCRGCGLVQLESQPPPTDLFGSEYPYLSSVSRTWRRHAAGVARHLMGRMGKRRTPFVLEIASNDGGQLLPFLRQGCRILGIEPSAQPTSVARALGVPTREIFFDSEVAERLASEVGQADAIILHNVLAHVPDPEDMLAGAAKLLRPDGLLSIESGYFGAMVEYGHFDTIYHQHRCYFSLASLEHLARRVGLVLLEARRTTLQGGSLSLILAKQGREEDRVGELRGWETHKGLESLKCHRRYAAHVQKKRTDIKNFLSSFLQSGQRLAAYGAAAKGTTLLATCDLNEQALAYVVDNNPIKQGLRMPGLALPIVSPDRLRNEPVDGVLVIAWNLADEVAAELEWFKVRGGVILAPLPEPRFV